LKCDASFTVTPPEWDLVLNEALTLPHVLTVAVDAPTHCSLLHDRYDDQPVFDDHNNGEVIPIEILTTHTPTTILLQLR